MQAALRSWLDIWLRPRFALDAVVAERREVRPFAVAAASALTACAAAAPGALRLDPTGAAWIAAGAAALLALAAVGYFVFGFLVNAVARAFGGTGTAASTRSALGLGAAPLIAGNLIALIAGERGGAVGLIAELVAEVSSFLLTLSLLAHVQGFGRLRALSGVLMALILLIGSILPAGVLALAIRSLVVQSFSAASASMAPTLLPGDLFFVSKAAYGYSAVSFPFGLAHFEGRLFARAPQRGDVVVFRHEGQDWVKRIVGLPGEKIQMIDGRVTIDGQTVERHLVTPDFKLRDSGGEVVSGAAYEETLTGGATHRIVQLQGDDGPLSHTDPFEVPPGHYFVLGDNRDNSMDSRMPAVGFVPLADLIGRAAVIYYSTARDPEAPSLSRMGTTVR